MSKKISFSICLFLLLWMRIDVSFATDIERVIGAKHLGMAAFTGVADGENAAIGNPARLPLIDRTELNIGGSRLLSDIYAYSMSVVGRPFDYGHFGLNVSYLNYGDDISRYDVDGKYIESMKVVDKFLALSYGKEILRGLSIGGKAKGIWLERIGENEKWKDSFRGLSGDVGLLYYRPYRQRDLFSIGICAQDIPKLFYEEKPTLSYPTINTGIAANFGSLPFGSLKIAADADFEIRKLADVFEKRKISLVYPETVSVGFEYCLRGGLDFRLGFSTGGFALDEVSFFGGLKIKTTSLGIDFAGSGHPILGFNQNAVSLHYIYGEEPKMEGDTPKVETFMPPVSEVLKLPEYTNSKSFDVTWGSDKGDSGIKFYEIQYKKGKDGEWTDWLKESLPGVATFVCEEEDTYYFRFRACDNAGNWEEGHPDEGDAYITVDTKTPEINDISPPKNSTIRNATPNISAKIIDKVSGVKWKDTVMTINGPSPPAVTVQGSEKDGINYTSTMPLPDGEYTVTIKTSDIAGNPPNEESWSFKIDTTPVSMNQYLPKWSPDGKKYACVEVAGREDQRLTIYDATNQNEIVSIQLNGLGQIAYELFPIPIDALPSTEAQIVACLLRAPAGFSWAPDSEHYVFINGKLSPTDVSQKGKYDFDLYIGNLKGETSQLTSDPAVELCPQWSPKLSDEQFIAYIHSGKICIQRILVHPNGVIEKPIASLFLMPMNDTAIAMFPEWAPDNNKIAFSAYQNNDFDIFIYDLVSNKLTQLTQTLNIREHHPVWSPDSEWLAFYSLQQDSQHLSISIAKADSASPIVASLSMEQFSEAATIDGYELQIADDVCPNVLLGPSWMPSGRHIVYIRNSDDYFIEAAEFNLSSVKKLQHRQVETGTTMNFDIQCAQNEAKLIFSHRVAAGGGVSFSNVKVYILPQAEFAEPTIPDVRLTKE